MKRLLSIAVLLLSLCIISSCDLKTKEYECDGMKFIQTEYKKLMLISFSGDAEEVTVPENLEGKEVTVVGSNAFDGSLIKKIILPKTVTEIQSSAFKNCKNLEEISLGLNVERIGSFAFYGCTALENINIPTAVTEIETAAFACSGLTEFQKANGVKVIGEQAFYGCADLKMADIPETVTTIGETAFYNCPQLEMIYIPDNVETIGKRAVGYLENTQGKAIISENTVICSRNNTVAFEYANKNNLNFAITAAREDLDYELVGNNAQISKYTGDDTVFVIPASVDGRRVVGISDKAFAYKIDIKSVTIPKTVTEIGQEAFVGCSSLEFVSLPHSVTDIGGGAFNETPWFIGLTEEFVTVGDGVLIDYNGTDANVIIPDGVKKISSAFAANLTIESVRIPQSVTEVGQWAFRFCTELKSVEFTSNVTTVGVGAFSWCVALESMDLSGGVENIGKEAFFGARALKKIEFFQGLKTIGRDAFGCCDVLTSVNLPYQLEKIEQNAFDKKTLLQIISKKNSEAWLYARKNDIKFIEG